jgi:hypothetical protein
VIIRRPSAFRCWKPPTILGLEILAIILNSQVEANQSAALLVIAVHLDQFIPGTISGTHQFAALTWVGFVRNLEAGDLRVPQKDANVRGIVQ